MRRAVLASAIAIGVAIGTAVPTSAIGLTQVTINCSDGTSATVIVDANELTSLTESVQAMIDFPAGLSCALLQSPVPLSFGAIALASPGSNPFIVAGGRWQVPCANIVGGGGGGGGGGGAVPGGTIARVAGSWSALSALDDEFIWVNIAVNVHQKDSTDTSGSPPFFGTLNETIPANQTCNGNPIGETHFTSKPTCLSIVPVNGEPPQAFVTSQVTQTSGAPFPADQSGSVSVDDYVHFGFQDNGNPPGRNPSGTPPTTDMLAGPPATAEGTQTQECDPAQWQPIYHLGSFDGQKQYGNISLHQ